MNPDFYLGDEDENDPAYEVEQMMKRYDNLEEDAKAQDALCGLLAASEPLADVLVNRYGALWSVRPISASGIEWIREYCDGDPGDQPFGIWSLAIPASDIVELVDGLHADHLTVV